MSIIVVFFVIKKKLKQVDLDIVIQMTIINHIGAGNHRYFGNKVMNVIYVLNIKLIIIIINY